ncbi:uracil phosphoribosyltransferase-domain-containing protein [Dunaliella salina]|uniref:uridine/cytidine kinase n=1 Tax=Dunaliella salina TaxID=3046 RepID=A0ABQ7H2L4_DUNSA|nr:uracil phosphoribosyltransferase-domain-containing protein [Dunaliella salina]KAF5841096.1 uracil phosphoribosyltransferase-domain-containing protein [Dunaliella salina]|eukprot:KAF5841095.1 uracil phosphoribosyltransferase-domain-containing protein [Dunaliella salina]
MSAEQEPNLVGPSEPRLPGPPPKPPSRERSSERSVPLSALNMDGLANSLSVVTQNSAATASCNFAKEYEAKFDPNLQQGSENLGGESPRRAFTASSPNFRQNRHPFIIGVAGGTASGKTTVCDCIMQRLHDQCVVMLAQDSFYRSLTQEEMAKVKDYNFDHPDAIDRMQLLQTVAMLKEGKSVEVPVYNFSTHKRSEETRHVEPADVIILEGILVLALEELRGLLNMKIYRLLSEGQLLCVHVRKSGLKKQGAMTYFFEKQGSLQLSGHPRPTFEHEYGFLLSQHVRGCHLKGWGGGRDVASVIEQYTRFVKPAFDQFIGPSRRYADIIIPWQRGDNLVAIDLITEHIRLKLQQHDLLRIYNNLEVIPSNFQMRGMHTIIRDRLTKKNDFVFYANRICRLVVEAGLGHLPFTEKVVTTPTGYTYCGVEFARGLCGVSVIRSGEAMEAALRECCQGIKIGKILVHRNEKDDRAQELVYEKLPSDIASRFVLLLDPVLGTGITACRVIKVLLDKGVQEDRILFLCLMAAPNGIHKVCQQFPKVKILTSEIDQEVDQNFVVVPGVGQFGDRYFCA